MYSSFLTGKPRCAGQGFKSNRLRRFPRLCGLRQSKPQFSEFKIPRTNKRNLETQERYFLFCSLTPAASCRGIALHRFRGPCIRAFLDSLGVSCSRGREVPGARSKKGFAGEFYSCIFQFFTETLAHSDTSSLYFRKKKYSWQSFGSSRPCFDPSSVKPVSASSAENSAVVNDVM
jgi:hypothetical protein